MNHHAHKTVSSPWGQGTIEPREGWPEGCFDVSTPSHGGFFMAAATNARIPAPLRNSGGWYEEDCEYAIPGYFIPELGMDREQCRKTIINWFPDEWEKYTGETLKQGESYIKDKQTIRESGALVAITAWGDWERNVPPGMVGVIATAGGIRNNATEHHFLIPKAEYDTRGPHGFIIERPDDYQTWTRNA